MTTRPEVRLSKWPALVVVLLASWLLLLLAAASGATLAAAEAGFTVPNPFFDPKNRQDDKEKHSDNFYHIQAKEIHTKGNVGLLNEYFSLGRAISLQVLRDESHQEYGLLTDGRSGKTYLVREPSKTKSLDELDCELDSTHSHKHLFPWQFIYDARRSGDLEATTPDSSKQVDNRILGPPVGLMPELESEDVGGNSTNKRRRNRSKKNKRNFKATIFGLGAIWLNMIRADVHSAEIDNDSRYYNMNNWALKTEHVDLDMMFMKGTTKRGQQLDQDQINKLQPAELHVNTKFRSRPDSAERRQFSRYVFKGFEQNILADEDELLGLYLRQLAWCKRLTRTHRTFPNLMRAMATYGDRVYRIEYVTRRFNLLGVDQLDGKFNERHHRYMFPQELVDEVFSLSHEIQSLIYDPNFDERQELGERARMDMFMSCYTERAEGRLARHAAQYYHQTITEGDQEHVCIKGQREPKPDFRLLSKAIKFRNERGIEYEGHLHGLGALLLNALEMRHSSNLLPLTIEAPLDYTQQEHRKVSVNVWQVVDERQKVRALFYIERRNPEVEKRQLDLAERDRNELARLVRIDIRSLASSKLVDIGVENEEGNNYLAVTQQLVESDADLLLQYHVFEIAFELDEVEQSIYLEVPDNCQERKSEESSAEDEDEDEEDEDLSDTANNYDKNYDVDEDDEDGHEPDEQADINDLEAEFQFESGLIEEDTPMPDFIQMLEGGVAYKFVSQIELAADEDDDEKPKAIWLEETMDLAREQLRLRIYLTRHDLQMGLPHEEFLILYQSEVVLKLWRVGREDEQRRCMRLDDVNLKWMRLLSAHLLYYVVAHNSAHKPTDQLDGEDLIAEENSLSSYGLGALWRRANQMGMSEYRGMKHERLVLNDGNGDQQFKQLVWLYQELDMTFEWTFLLKDDGDDDNNNNNHHHHEHIPTDLRLHSVLIRNEHGAASSGLGEQLNHFKPVRIIVESFEMDGNGLRNEFGRIAPECDDILVETRRMTEIDRDVRPPDYKAVLGAGVQHYELEYTIYTNRNRPTSREEQLGLVPPRSSAEAKLSNVPVRESFDLAAGLGKISIYEHEPSKSLEIFIDNKRKLYLAYSSLINKCSRLTHLAPTYGTLLSTLVFDNEHFEPDKLHGLMGLWQALSENLARLHVRQLLLENGNSFEQQTYSQLILKKPDQSNNNNNNNKEDLREEVKLHFEKRRPTRYGAPKIYKPDKMPIRRHELTLHMIEMRSVSKNKRQLAREPFTRIAINRLQEALDDKWKLPRACQEELNASEPSDSDSEPESIGTNDHERSGANERPALVTNPGEFPKLSTLFARSKRFQMRSESSTYGGFDKLQLIDELYNEGSFRLRTRALGADAEGNCDLLMFDNTRDQFDLSEPLRCPRLHDLEPGLVSRCLSPSLYNVWLGHKHSDLTASDDNNFEAMKNLAGLHYGPLSLWRLAEQISLRRPEQMKLIKTIEMSKTSFLETNEQFRQRLEHQMDTEIWQVNADQDETKSWSFLLHFAKYSTSSELQEDTWHVLERVSVTDVREGTGEKFMVLVETVNYNWLPDEAQFGSMFRLPEAWNCQRRLLAADEDERTRSSFKLRSNLNKQLTYETSLELFDELELDFGLNNLDLGPLRMESYAQRKPLSTQMGAFLTGGDLDGLLPAHWQDEHSEATKQPAPRFDMDLHQSITRLVGGRSMARQLVTDRRAQISYHMNMITGECMIGPEPIPSWEVRFLHDKDNSPEVIKMAENLRRLQSYDLFTKLFLADEDDSGNRLFHLLNKYTEAVSIDDGVTVNIVHETYEYEYPSLMLNPMLSGPARIVREFSLAEMNGRLSNDPKSMPYITVRVYLLQKDRSKVRAILSMRVQQVREAALSEFLNMAQFAECFNEGQPLSDRRQASMTIEYPMLSHMDRLMAHMNTEAIREQFYALLLAQNRLWPSQLDGRARLEFTGHDNLLRVHFNVLEAPTSMVYFQTLHMCTISDTLISLIETRILPNQLACSRWCDQINCAAVSFCADSQCNVLPARAFAKHIASSNRVGGGGKLRPAQRSESASKYADEWHHLLSNCASTGTCTYFYNRQMIKPRPLDAFRDFLDRTVNLRSNKLALKELSLPLGNSQRFLEPARFYESDDKFRWQHEDFSDPFEEVLSSSVDSLAPLPGDADTSQGSSGPLASGGDRLELADSFSVWHSQARLPVDAGNVDQLNTKLGLGHSSKFLIMWASASSRAGCLQECQRNRCLLVSSCGETHHCAMIVASGTESALKLGALHEIVETDYAKDCTISIRDHLELFHQFENTQKPQRYSHQLDDYTREECAVACETLGANCLAFDWCATPASASSAHSNRAVCFLQDTHVSQDAFDRSILLPAWDRDDTSSTEASQRDGPNHARATTCDHHSKSLLAGFYQRIPNVKLNELHQSELEGVSADKCAADCLQDDTCRGFEHCQNPKRAPTQSCYPIRSTGGHEAMPAASLKDQLVLSRACSIYLPKASLTRMRTEQALGVTAQEAGDRPGNWLAHLMGYLLVTACLGAIVQLAYVKLGGRRPIQLHGDRF